MEDGGEGGVLDITEPAVSDAPLEETSDANKDQCTDPGCPPTARPPVFPLPCSCRRRAFHMWRLSRATKSSERASVCVSEFKVLLQNVRGTLPRLAVPGAV